MATEIKIIEDIIKKYYTKTEDNKDREYRDDIIEVIAHFNKRLADAEDNAKKINYLTPCLDKKDGVTFEKDMYKIGETNKSAKSTRSGKRKRGVFIGIKRNATELPEIETPESQQVPSP